MKHCGNNETRKHKQDMKQETGYVASWLDVGYFGTLKNNTHEAIYKSNKQHFKKQTNALTYLLLETGNGIRILVL